HDAQSGQEEDQDRRLEDEACRQNDHAGEREIVVDCHNLLEVLARLDEEAARRRKEKAESEISAGDEKNRGEENERHRVTALALVETGRDEKPQLMQHEWRRQEESGEERHLHVEKERTGQARERELVAGREKLRQRLFHPREDGVGVSPADREARSDRDEREEKPFAKLLEVLEERHLLKLALEILAFSRRRERSRFRHDSLGGADSPAGRLRAGATSGSVLDTVSTGVITGGEICRNSSSRTSRSTVFFRSSVAFLNSASVFPRVRPISGSRFG